MRNLRHYELLEQRKYPRDGQDECVVKMNTSLCQDTRPWGHLDLPETLRGVKGIWSGRNVVDSGEHDGICPSMSEDNQHVVKTNILYWVECQEGKRASESGWECWAQLESPKGCWQPNLMGIKREWMVQWMAHTATQMRLLSGYKTS